MVTLEPMGEQCRTHGAGEVLRFSPSDCSPRSSPKSASQALSVELERVARSDKTRLTFIPEQNRAVAHRFAVVLCGRGATDLARRLCTSEINEEYRPRGRQSDAMRSIPSGGTEVGPRLSNKSLGALDVAQQMTRVPTGSTTDFGYRESGTSDLALPVGQRDSAWSRGLSDFGLRDSGDSRGSQWSQAHRTPKASRSPPSSGAMDIGARDSDQSHGSLSSRRRSEADEQDEFRTLFVTIGASGNVPTFPSVPGVVGDVPAPSSATKHGFPSLMTKTASLNELANEPSSLCRIRFVAVESFSASMPTFSNKAEMQESAIVFLFQSQGARNQEEAEADESIRDFKMRVAEMNFHSHFIPLVLVLCVNATQAEEDALLYFASSARLKTQARIKLISTLTDDEDELISKMGGIADMLRKQKSPGYSSESTPSIEFVDDSPGLSAKDNAFRKGSKESRTCSKGSSKSAKSSRSSLSGGKSSQCSVM